MLRCGMCARVSLTSPSPIRRSFSSSSIYHLGLFCIFQNGRISHNLSTRGPSYSTSNPSFIPYLIFRHSHHHHPSSSQPDPQSYSNRIITPATPTFPQWSHTPLLSPRHRFRSTASTSRPFAPCQWDARENPVDRTKRRDYRYVSQN